VELESACRRTPPNARLGAREPYTEIRETVAEYFNIADAVDNDLVEYRHDLMEIFPKRPPGSRGRIARKPQNAQSAARFIQQHQQLLETKLSDWIGKSDRRVIKTFL